MWLWNRDSEFTKWQQRAMWYVALGWHAIEFAQTSAILEFYIWFQFRPHHCSRHVILHQSAKFYPNHITLGRKKWRHVDFPDSGSQPSLILGFIIGSLKSPCTTSYRSSIQTIALNCLDCVFCILATDRQTNRHTNKQMNNTDALSHSRCRDRRLNNMKLVHWPLMGRLLHLVQRGGDWAGPQPAQVLPRCTKCNSQPINGQCTNQRIAV